MTKLARDLWTKTGGDTPKCERCGCLVHQCRFLNTENHDSSCLVSLELELRDVNVLQRAVRLEEAKLE
jgi:hypothetical protein